MKKIVVSTSTFAEYDSRPLDLCKENGLNVVLNPYKRKVNPDELIKLAHDAQGIIMGTEQLSESMLLELKFLKVISRCGAGLDNVDLNAAKRLGIKVFNTPDAPTLSVAELTIGLILNLLRKITTMDNLIRAGRWEKLSGNLLDGKKAGIIGFGRIGQKVAELLSAFGVEIGYCDLEEKKPAIKCVRMDLGEILSWSEIVTLHLSVSKNDKPIIGENEIGMMRENSWLINVSRGGVVDEGALYQAVKDKRLSGAAIDVFEREPYSGPLKELDNVILTPHIGSYAKEARVKMEIEAVNNLLAGLGDYRGSKR